MVTNNSLNVGNETDGTILQGKGGAAPAFTTATYPDTQLANRVMYSTANNVVGGRVMGSNRMFTTDATGLPHFNTRQEDGNWDPLLRFGGGSTGITYGVKERKFVSIGKTQFYYFLMVLTSKGTDTGVATIYGQLHAPGAVPTSMCAFITDFDLTLDVGYTQILSREVAGVRYFDLYECGTGVATTQLDDTHFTNTSRLGGVVSYIRD